MKCQFILLSAVVVEQLNRMGVTYLSHMVVVLHCNQCLDNSGLFFTPVLLNRHSGTACFETAMAGSNDSCGGRIRYVA